MTEVAATPSLVAKISSRRILAALLLFVLVVIPFLPALHGQFTWDDESQIVNNPQVHAWNSLPLIWNPRVQSIQYFPLTFTTFWAEHKLWGLDTTGYHFDNMLLQAGAAVLLWLTLRRLGLPAAWFAALLWAIHPIQADSVAWVAERKNTLSGLFYFLTAWSYLRFATIGDPVAEASNAAVNEDLRSRSAPRQWLFFALALIAFVAALLSKTLVCTLPAGILIILWWKRQKISWRDVLPVLPFFLVSAIFSLITALQEKSNVAVAERTLDFTFPERLIFAGKNIWFYFQTILFPYPLMAIYPRWNYDPSRLLNYLPALGVFLLLAGLFAARNKIGKWPLAAYLFFLSGISPLLGFISFYTMHYTFVADHYQYIASLGLLVPLAELLRRIGITLAAALGSSVQARRGILFLSGLIFIVGLGSLTAFYASLFQTNFQLWSWNVEHNPAASAAQHNLGIAYLNRGDIPHATEHITIALHQQPDDGFVQASYGRLCRNRGDFQEAVEHFKTAIKLRPQFGINYDELGITYQLMRMPQLALEQFAAAVQVDGGDPKQHVLYAEALVHAKQFDAAVEQYKMALVISPGNLITRYNFANLLLDMGRFPESIEQYLTIIKIQDNNPLIWHNLAAAYYQSGKIELALAAKKKADDLDALHAPAPPAPPSPLSPPSSLSAPAP